ncbi:MAG: hypothetical protein KDD50_16350 [Bdellovibrionales bacterium]|nr:hypothetical protein [Bdellovibrionales bacterium]
MKILLKLIAVLATVSYMHLAWADDSETVSPDEITTEDVSDDSSVYYPPPTESTEGDSDSVEE